MLLALPTQAGAVLQNAGGSLGIRNTSTDALSLAELAAYDLQGRFRGFVGTPISDRFFLTARHIGISASDWIVFSRGPNSGSYPILAWHDDPESDLRVVEIDGRFRSWARLDYEGNESGRTAIFFGRGGAPAETIVVDAQLKGWRAGTPGGAISWGHNVVNATVGGDQLQARFNRAGLPTEAGLTDGDSGGGWFVPDDSGALRLTGVSFATTGPFQRDRDGSPDGVVFDGAMVDFAGLWIGPAGAEFFLPDQQDDQSSVLLATRIYDRLSWIESVTGIDAGDSDGDGFADAVDNCPFTTNPSQLDSGGLGAGSAPDGIGDACQCGDVNGDGQVEDGDATLIKRFALGLAAPDFVSAGQCDVTGDGACTGTDGTAVRHASRGLPFPGFGENCENATIGSTNQVAAAGTGASPSSLLIYDLSHASGPIPAPAWRVPIDLDFLPITGEGGGIYGMSEVTLVATGDLLFDSSDFECPLVDCLYSPQEIGGGKAIRFTGGEDLQGDFAVIRDLATVHVSGLEGYVLLSGGHFVDASGEGGSPGRALPIPPRIVAVVPEPRVGVALALAIQWAVELARRGRLVTRRVRLESPRGG